jgi:TfoX/Sxy family transcriptional regulator of competence genes
MGSKQSTVDFIIDQISSVGDISAKKMFGEYGIYCGEKIFGFVCDDQLFIKPTHGGKVFLGECDEAPPYPGAKPYFVIPDEKWDDHEWLSGLVAITVAQLPIPKKKTAKKPR